MLASFRKAKRVSVVLLTVMLLLPVQQSFAQNMDWNLHKFSFAGASYNNADQQMNMSECSKMSMGSEQQADCCDDSTCDPGHCSSSVSFFALFLNHDLLNSTISQQPVFSVEQREISFLTSELFRPPRKI